MGKWHSKSNDLNFNKDYFNNLFTYDDGNLIPKVKLVKKAVGLKLNKSGKYAAVTINGSKFFHHRIIYTMFFGTIPRDCVIDHIDGDKHNNKIENLRLATLSENAANSKIHKDNTLGVKGVHLHSNGSYRVQVCVKGKRNHIGLYKTLEEAKASYTIASKVLFQEFANGGYHRKTRNDQETTIT